MQKQSIGDSKYEWKAVLLLSAGFGLVGIDRFMIAPMFPDIMRDLDLNYQDLGNITAALSIAWGASALFMGRLSDRVGRRSIIIGSLLAFSLLIGVSGLAMGMGGLVIVRALMGLADGAYTPTSISATIDASKPSRHGLNVGVQQMAMPLFGLAIAPLLVTRLLEVMSWRWVFSMLTVPGLLLAFLMYKVLRNQYRSDETRHESASSAWKDALHFHNVRVLMAGMLCWLTCLVTTSAMMPSYLIDHLHLGPMDMGTVMSAIGFGAAAGCLTLPALSDRVGRKPVMVVATIGACLSIFALSQTGPHVGHLFLFLGLTHFFNFALITLTVGPLSAESVPAAQMATASGLVVGVGELFGGGLAPVLAGGVAQNFGIEHVLYLAVAGLVVGFFVMLFLRETSPRHGGAKPAYAPSEDNREVQVAG